MRKIIVIYSLCLAAIASTVAVLKYCNLPIGERVITIFAVAAGMFLVAEGGYKIARYNNEIFIRILRMLVGAILIGFHFYQLF